jgi:hypothetical protein
MTPPLSEGRLVEAFDAGLAAIEALVAAKGMARGSSRRVLSDALVQGDSPGSES